MGRPHNTFVRLTTVSHLVLLRDAHTTYVKTRRAQVPAVPNVTHVFRVALSGTNASGAMWTGTVTNAATQEMMEVGTLFYPHLPDRVGFGNLVVQSDDFLEYFAGGDCDGAVQTSVGIEGPYFVDGACAFMYFPSLSLLRCCVVFLCAHARGCACGGICKCKSRLCVSSLC